MAPRTKPQSRKSEGAEREAQAEPRPKRRVNGTYEKGTSGNPGGLTREQRAIREEFFQELPGAMELIRKWKRSKKHNEQKAAVDVILTRSIGKAVKASELPDLEPVPEVEATQTSSASLLVKTREMMAKAIAGYERRQTRGELGLEDAVHLGDLAHSLAELVKAEKESLKHSNAAGMSTQELLEQTLCHATDEEISAALAKRTAQKETRDEHS